MHIPCAAGDRHGRARQSTVPVCHSRIVTVVFTILVQSIWFVYSVRLIATGYILGFQSCCLLSENWPGTMRCWCWRSDACTASSEGGAECRRGGFRPGCYQ
ncbi:hypothetical protein DFH29DRAFT_1069231 [Suillus ampliporus]|nr:hypothetical protein DFH29DRAFT_1069231 [Suillus ampliporus]